MRNAPDSSCAALGPTKDPENSHLLPGYGCPYLVHVKFAGLEWQFRRSDEFDPSAPKARMFWSYVRRASQEFGWIGKLI